MEPPRAADAYLHKGSKWYGTGHSVRAGGWGSGGSPGQSSGEKELAGFQPKKETYFLALRHMAFSWPQFPFCAVGSRGTLFLTPRVSLTRGKDGRYSAWCTVYLTIWLVSVDGGLFIGILLSQMLPRFLDIDPHPLKSRIYGLAALLASL